MQFVVICKKLLNTIVLLWWARKEKFQTLAQLPFQIDFHQVDKHPLYQEIVAAALYLNKLGLNISTIARRLCVGYKTVVKAIKWIENSESYFIAFKFPPNLAKTEL